jgi:hypothetical protein
MPQANELDQSPEAKRIRFLAGMFLLAVKYGQLGNLIEITLQAIKAGSTWLAYTERMCNAEKYWKQKVSVALDDYKFRHPEKFGEAVVHDDGSYKRWEEANAETLRNRQIDDQ